MSPLDAPAPRLLAGFGNPVLDSQACFRALLKALSFPGRRARVPAATEAPDGWPPALAAAALTLLDADTPVWLDAAARTPVAEAFLRFHAGAPIVDRPDAARFAVLLAPEAAPYDAFAIGTDQYPDRSVTLLIAVEALAGGQAMRLRGPGIRDAAEAAPAGALDAFWTAWARNHALYPLGFDAFFFAGEEALGLPRGVQAETLSKG